MDKFKLTLLFFLLISIAIATGVFICKCRNCCIDFSTTTNEDKENLKSKYSYAMSLIDSIQKQDSVYIKKLNEINSLIKNNCKVKISTNDSCTCSEKKIYEFNDHSYQKIQYKLSILQKNISNRRREIHHKLTEFILKDSSDYKIQKNEY